jgi:hypothetical protein
MLSADSIVDRNASCQVLRRMPLLTQDSIGCERRECNLLLKELVQGDLGLAGENVAKWNPSDSRKLEPLMVEPVLELDKEKLLAIALLEQPDCNPFNDRDELRIVRYVGSESDSVAHILAERRCSDTARGRRPAWHSMPIPPLPEAAWFSDL